MKYPFLHCICICGQHVRHVSRVPTLPFRLDRGGVGGSGSGCCAKAVRVVRRTSLSGHRPPSPSTYIIDRKLYRVQLTPTSIFQTLLARVIVYHRILQPLGILHTASVALHPALRAPAREHTQPSCDDRSIPRPCPPPRYSWHYHR